MIKRITEKNIIPLKNYLKLINKSLGDDKVNILSKYKCKLNHARCHLVLSEEYLIIEDHENTYKLSCSNINKVSIDERFWSIRVKFKYKGKIFRFDFPSLKKATQFYEQLIYSKVKSHVH